MKMLNKSIYFTLHELEDEGLFSSFLTNYPLSSLAYKGYESTYSAVVNGLISIISIRFSESYILRKDYGFFENPPSITSEDVAKISKKFQNILNLTTWRYLTLLQEYEKYRSDPTGKISATSSGTTRFNDTPQMDGDYVGDTYTTNITRSETSSTSDTGSIMERLDQLYKKWRNVLKDWSNEFLGLFKEVWEN